MRGPWKLRDDNKTLNVVVTGSTGNIGKALCPILEKRGFKVFSGLSLPETIHSIIYLAGISHVGPIETTSDTLLDEIVRVNLTGPFVLARDLSPRLTDGSSFILISSIMATHPYPHRSLYAMTKAGLEGLTRALAVDWGERGISTYCVRLGHLDRMMRTSEPNDELLRSVRNHTPSRSLVTRGEIASFIADLCDNRFPAMSGSVIDFDYGYCMNRYPL